jgi:PAS domain S-box-containing protein
MARKILRPGIVKTFLVYFLIISILPLLAVGGASYYVAARALTEQATRFEQASVDHQRDMLDLRLGQIENLMSDILGDEEINKVVRNPGDNASTYTRLATKARIGQILNSYFLNLDGLVSIGIYGLDNVNFQVGDTLDVEDIRQDVETRLLQETLASGAFIHWSGLVDNINAKSPHGKVISATSVFFSTDQTTLEKHPVALLVASYSLETFAAGLQETTYGPGSYFTVIDALGRYIYHPDAARIGARPDPGLLDIISTGTQGDGIDLQGATMVVKSAVFGRNGWHVSSFIPLDTLKEPVRYIRLTTLAILGICLAVIGLMAYRVSQYVVAPIRRVTGAFQAFEKGELNPDEKLLVRGTDEISDLVRWQNSFREVVGQQQAAQEALKESEARFRDFTEASSDWFWETDASHRMIMLSARFFATVNVAREDVLNLSRIEFTQRLAADSDDYFWQAHLRDLEAHRPFRVIYPLKDRDGKLHYLRSSGKPFFDAQGKFLGYRGTGTDASKEIADERALIDMNRTLEEKVRQRTEALWVEKERAQLANRSKTEFLNNMSHELRTPLNAILGFADVMRSGLFGPIDNPRYASYVRDIHAAGTYLLEILSDILDLSRIEINQLQMEEEVVDLQSLLIATQHMISHRAKNGNVELISDIEPALPRLTGDARRLKQIVLNLLSNAVKFTRSGGWVRLRSWSDEGGRVRIEIVDNGIGIADDFKQIVFEPFGKVENSYAREHEGIGLGLSIVKSLVQMHGGSIAMWSEAGEGTTITITFPASRTVLQDATVIAGSE